ncbi:hypothetical protein [Kangiella sp.]|uniref:hypothetical protein n=1 Tax=Kangiella sp. TaxID=1920245 RepID=UPI003A902748
MSLLQEDKRMSFGDWVDKVFEVALIALIGYAVTKIDAIQKDISSLNQTLAVTVERISNQESRIRKNENNIIKLKDNFEVFKNEYYRRGK